MATFPYAWVVSIAPVPNQSTYAHDLLRHGYKDAYVQWKAETGWEPLPLDRWTFMSDAIYGGLPELALYHFGSVDLHIFLRDAWKN